MSAAGADETRISGFVNDANTGIAIMPDGRVATAMRIGGTSSGGCCRTSGCSGRRGSGSDGQEPPIAAGLRLIGGAGLSPTAVSKESRLLQGLGLTDSWFNPPSVLDLSNGKVARVPAGEEYDYTSMGWLSDGKIMALRIGLRSQLWKLQQAREYW